MIGLNLLVRGQQASCACVRESGKIVFVQNNNSNQHAFSASGLIRRSIFRNS